MLSEIPAGLAEDVVRGKVRLSGGGALLPGLASRIETAAGIGTVLVEDPLRCVIRGAAEILNARTPSSSLASPGCVRYRRRYSSGCRPMADGSRPAISQPTTAATVGMPTTMISRFQTGTLASPERPSSGLAQA
jgi:MreB/Mbl protein